MRFLCRIGWHKWGKWSRSYYVAVLRDGADSTFDERRARNCTCCGWTDETTIRTFLKFTGGHSPPRVPKWED